MCWKSYKERISKSTSKDQICEYCGRVIPKGSKNILNWSGKYNGVAYNSYACHWCVEHEDNFTDKEMDFYDVLYYDVFNSVVQQLKNKGYEDIVIQFDNEDQNYLSFYNDKTWEIIHREYMPIIKGNKQ